MERAPASLDAAPGERSPIPPWTCGAWLTRLGCDEARGAGVGAGVGVGENVGAGVGVIAAVATWGDSAIPRSSNDTKSSSTSSDQVLPARPGTFDSAARPRLFRRPPPNTSSSATAVAVKPATFGLRPGEEPSPPVRLAVFAAWPGEEPSFPVRPALSTRSLPSTVAFSATPPPPSAPRSDPVTNRGPGLAPRTLSSSQVGRVARRRPLTTSGCAAIPSANCNPWACKKTRISATDLR